MYFTASVKTTDGNFRVGTSPCQFDYGLDHDALAVGGGLGRTAHVSTGTPDHLVDAAVVLLVGQPRQAAVTHHRVTDDRQRTQRRHRHRKRAALQRPEVVVVQVEVPQRRRVTRGLDFR